jgi:hypothetical protein
MRKLVESCEVTAGRVTKRTVATLGSLDSAGGEFDTVINGLLKVAGRKPLGEKPKDPSVSFASARSSGSVRASTHRARGGPSADRVFRSLALSAGE